MVQGTDTSAHEGMGPIKPPSRRAVLAGFLSSLFILPVARLIRVKRSGFVERGGWILKRSDIE